MKGYSSNSLVLICNVLSGTEIDGKFVSVEKVSAKTVYQRSVKLKLSKLTSQKCFKKCSTLVIRTFGTRDEFIYFLPGYQ